MKITQRTTQYSIAFPVRGALSILIILILWMLLGCSALPQQKSIEFPENPGYLIAGQNESKQFADNALLIFNKSNLAEVKKIDIPKSKIEVAEMDPQGNLWLGLSGGSNWDDNRVMVFNSMGEKKAEITTCLYPNIGIHFYAQKAYVVCRDTGFYATVIEVDANSYQVLQSAQLKLDGDRSFMAVSSAFSGSNLVVGGLTNGSSDNFSYTVLLIVDVRSLSKTAKQIELGEGTNVWAIIPYGNNIYALNSEGDRNLERKDVFVVDMNRLEIVNSVSMPNPSPLWGVRQGNSLFTFHNGSWNSIFSPLERAMCRTDLDTLKSVCYHVPDDFNAYDIGILNNQPCVTHWGDQLSGGLYCLDQQGVLKLSIPFDDASLIIQNQ